MRLTEAIYRAPWGRLRNRKTQRLGQRVLPAAVRVTRGAVRPHTTLSKIFALTHRGPEEGGESKRTDFLTLRQTAPHRSRTSTSADFPALRSRRRIRGSRGRASA